MPCGTTRRSRRTATGCSTRTLRRSSSKRRCAPTTRHPGYEVSQRVRKRIEEAFGWAKTVAGLAKAKLRGTARNAFKFTFTMAAYNLIRLPRLLAAA
ncbi:MAG: transposase [Hyphomicrobium sp.]